MSISVNLPFRSELRPVSARFSATYNATTPFLYDFNIPANVQALTETKGQRLYMLEQFDFDLNIDRGDFQTAIGLNAEPFLKLDFQKQKESPIYHRPWPLTSFKQNKQHVIFFESPQMKDKVQATFRCQLDQTFNLVPYSTIVATWSAVLYEIYNKEFIKQYLKSQKKTTGDSFII